MESKKESKKQTQSKERKSQKANTIDGEMTRRIASWNNVDNPESADGSLISQDRATIAGGADQNPTDRLPVLSWTVTLYSRAR